MIRLIFFIVLGSIVSCISPPDYSDIPSLEFKSVSKTAIKQGLVNVDSFTLVLFFTDGDGDFGYDAKSNELNIFMKDNRTGQVFRDFKAPLVPTQGANNGISGTISILISSTCCVFPEVTGIPPCSVDSSFLSNDLSLDIYIKDRAGNQSNTVTTSVIKLMCI